MAASRRVAAMLALLCLAGAPAAAGTASADRVDILLQAFAEAALRTESGHPVPLRRWTAPLAVRIDGDAAAGRADAVRRHVEQLAGIAGLPVTFLAAHEAGANLLIVIERRAAYIVNGRAVRCYTMTRADDRGAIRSAEIRINLADRRAGDCMAHELMHALGLPGHPHGIATVLCDGQRRVHPTDEDEALLRLLYGPGLAPGLPPAAALARARAPLAALLGPPDNAPSLPMVAGR